MIRTRLRSVTPGRGWAYIGAGLGGLVSIAANVAHTYLSGSPERLAVAMSVFWPVALFVAVEILARTRWPSGRRWIAIRFLGLLPVALVAAVVSYRHLSGLLAHYSEDPLTVAIGPLAVDGLMVMATAALLATTNHTTEPSASSAPLVEVLKPNPVTVPPDPWPTAPPPYPVNGRRLTTPTAEVTR
jgi:hypothetical protein